MASQSYGNVYFLGVARISGQAYVVASYSYNSETDIGGVKQVLEQPNMNMVPGKHYSFSVAQSAWHLIAGIFLFLISLSNILIVLSPIFVLLIRRKWIDLHFNL